MILIRSVKVIDGTGKAPFTADVLIKENQISAIGYFPSQTTDTVIDGLGGYLTPGFIDIHTDSDHLLNLFTDPNQKSFLLQGVTTIIGGNCGSSLAPLLYGSLESIRKWTDINQINVNWQTMAEFLSVIQKRGVGVNFGTLVGHSTIRRALIGEDRRDLTEKELNIFKSILEKSLQEGALGMSTGLSYAHACGTSFREIKLLVEVLKKYNALYATHLRNEKENLIDSIKETTKLAEDTGVKTIISHFRPLIGFEEQFQQTLELINKTKSQLYFDTYPFDISFLPIYSFLPQWAQVGGLEIMISRLLDEHLSKNIIKELPMLKRDGLVIASAPGNEFLIGKTIGEFSKNQGITPIEGLFKLMIATRLKALVFYKNINLELIKDILTHSKAFITSNSIKMTDKAFMKFLEIVVKEKKSFTLEQAIQKITSFPADKLNLKGRGVIKEKNIADLVLLKENNNKFEVEAVILGGRIVVKNGNTNKVLAGQVIKSII